jgi:hypothetical protein
VPPVLSTKVMVNSLVIGIFIALVAYGVAAAGLGIASFFVVPAVAAPFVIVRLRGGMGQSGRAAV